MPTLIVKGVPEDCEKLNSMSKKIARHLKLNENAFVYRGESLSRWTENLRLLVCKIQRTYRPKDELDKILAKYDWRCARCDENGPGLRIGPHAAFV